MTPRWRSYPKRFMRWLSGSPFRRLPPVFGNPVPTDLHAFEAEADDASLRGFGLVMPERTLHQKTRQFRPDSSL
jgi:hypothetical protein